MAARSGQFPGLQIEGSLGEDEGQNTACEYYTQLPLKESILHYKRINDAFLFPDIIRLKGDTEFRLNKEVMDLVKKGGCWSI